MGVLDYNKLSKYYAKKKVNESKSTGLESDLDSALSISRNKIGKDRDMSFDAINQVLDKIPSDLLKEAELNPTIQKIYLNLVNPETLEMMTQYVDKESKDLSDIIERNSGKSGSSKILSRDDEYVSDFNHSANIVTRFEKIYTIYSRSDEGINLDSDTEILRSLRSMDASLNLEKMNLKGSGKIGKIGGVDDGIDKDLFEIIMKDESPSSSLLPKDSISTILKQSKGSSDKNEEYSSEHKRRKREVVSKSSESIKSWYRWASSTFTELTDDIKKSDDVEGSIDSAQEFSDNTGGSVFNMVFNYGDDKTTMTNQIRDVERRVGEGSGRTGIRRKKQIFRRIKESIAVAALPVSQSGEIQREGDYYALFKVLMEERNDWMNTILMNKIFSGQTSEFNTFVSDIETEVASESYQLNYLNSCYYWALKFIDSDYISTFTEKESDNYRKTLESIVLEKKTEIRNFYLSKGFNLSDFKSVLIKPEVDIPLYSTVTLAISEEDRKKESPLMNFLTGSKDLIFSILGGGIYVDTQTLAKGKRFGDQNRAIGRGISQAVKGIVGIAGGTQASRNYDKIMRTDKDEKVQEDMLSPMDSPSASMTPMEGPGSTFQTPMTMSGDMDLLSLAGPSGGNLSTKRKTKKKKSSKRKKKSIPFGGNSKVLNFEDFMKNSGY